MSHIFIYRMSANYSKKNKNDDVSKAPGWHGIPHIYVYTYTCICITYIWFNSEKILNFSEKNLKKLKKTLNMCLCALKKTNFLIKLLNFINQIKTLMNKSKFRKKPLRADTVVNV